MRGALYALLLWQATASPGGSPLLSPVAFRDRLEAAVTAITHQPVANLDDRTFRTKQVSGTELTVSIDNVYPLYQADPSSLDAIVSRYAGVLAAPVQEGATLDQLVVIVRPSDYITRSLPPGASTANFLPPRPMASDLSLFLAIDAPDTIRPAGPADLRRWNIDVAEAWRRAVVNIKQRIGPLQPTRLGNERGAVGFGAASGLAPSMLADPSVCGPTAQNGIRGQLVLLYARDMFLYADPTDTAMTSLFWSVVKAETAAGRSLSSTVLTCRSGRWEVAAPPAK